MPFSLETGDPFYANMVRAVFEPLFLA